MRRRGRDARGLYDYQPFVWGADEVDHTVLELANLADD